MNAKEIIIIRKALEREQFLHREAERFMVSDAEKYAYCYRVLAILEKELGIDRA